MLGGMSSPSVTVDVPPRAPVRSKLGAADSTPPGWEGLSSVGAGADTGPAGAGADPLVPSSIEALDLATVLQAFSDPVRLRIVAKLADGEEYSCGSFGLPVAKSTCSHHFRVLREAGVVEQRVDGKCRLNRLRRAQLEKRFPGLLAAVLAASRP